MSKRIDRKHVVATKLTTKEQRALAKLAHDKGTSISSLVRMSILDMTKAA